MLYNNTSQFIHAKYFCISNIKELSIATNTNEK